MLIALTSLLTNKPVRSDVAMTGEITLRGLVLPVGGIKEKVLAGMRAGIRTIILHKKNEKDLEEIPERIRNEMHFKFIQRMDGPRNLVPFQFRQIIRYNARAVEEYVSLHDRLVGERVTGCTLDDHDLRCHWIKSQMAVNCWVVSGPYTLTKQ